MFGSKRFSKKNSVQKDSVQKDSIRATKILVEIFFSITALSDFMIPSRQSEHSYPSPRILVGTYLSLCQQSVFISLGRLAILHHLELNGVPL